jgi:probable phosphoglycerate mutase
MRGDQKWPDTLWIVRHGESAGNVALAAALEAQLHLIDIELRDCDVPLSELGHDQAIALGAWFGQLPANERPEVIICSPYIRAQQTAQLLLEGAGIDRNDLTMVVDERLREKEFGVLDRLTSFGIAEHYPEQAEFRRILGKFYHRPPGGESWCDVILRLRSLVDTVSREYSGERVMFVCHSVVVLCLRYLLEQMTEEQILEIDRTDAIANCSVTKYRFDQDTEKRGTLQLEMFNFVAPLVEAGEPVTSDPDANIAAR